MDGAGIVSGARLAGGAGNTDLRITVVQPGARLHYAVPQIFARAGVLRALYTDAHADHWWGKAARRLLPTCAPAALRRFVGRNLPEGLPRGSVIDFPAAALLQAFARRAGGTFAHDAILRAMSSASFGPADVIYTVMINEDIETLTRIRQSGARIVHECMIGPDVGEWVLREAELFPSVETAPDRASIDAGRVLDRAKYALADLILVPSEFTAGAVRRLCVSPERVRVVPYGLDVARYAGASVDPQPGRVLTVGSVGLRKGHPYLAAASREIARRGLPATFRVAGPVPAGIDRHPLLAGPAYLGQVPRGQITEEFQAADIFVLPTLADSFSLAHLEALAHGLPVITTPNCGSVVRDGIEGFIVPIRDSVALADRIELLVSDRRLRDRMSEAARARAAEFTLERYSERLLGAVREAFG